MESKNLKESNERMIHVRLPEDIHKEIRISAAGADETIQKWVARAIKNELARRNKKS